MYCAKCGHEITEEAAFCHYCGNDIQSSDEAGNSLGFSTNNKNLDYTIAATRRKPSIPLIIGIIALVIIVVIVFTFVFAPSLGISPKGSVNDYTWEELSKISAEIAKSSDESSAIDIAKKYNLVNSEGRLDGTQIKTVVFEDGSQRDVQISGFLHDDRSDGGKAGITFIFKDPLSQGYINWTDADKVYASRNRLSGDVIDLDADYENLGGWTSSQLRECLNNEILNYLPDDLKKNMVSVIKYTNNVKGSRASDTVQSDSDLLWLYSLVELSGNDPIFSNSDSTPLYYNDVLNAEGSQYQLFKDMKVQIDGDNDILVRVMESGIAYAWVTRSLMPATSYERDGEVIFGFDTISSNDRPLKTDLYYEVSDTGDLSTYIAFPTSRTNIVPGFCI